MSSLDQNRQEPQPPEDVDKLKDQLQVARSEIKNLR